MLMQALPIRRVANCENEARVSKKAGGGVVREARCMKRGVSCVAPGRQHENTNYRKICKFVRGEMKE